MPKKSQKTTQSSWVDLVYSSTIYVFARDGNLDGEFLNVCPSLDRGVLTPNEDERICNEYGYCVVPFYECNFSVLGLRLPFTAFDIEVLKHMVMTPS